LVSFSVSASNLLQWRERKEEMREKQWNEGGIGEKMDTKEREESVILCNETVQCKEVLSRQTLCSNAYPPKITIS